MASVHQALESIGTAIAVMRGEKIHAVVSPPALPRELRHRHEFDMCHAELNQVIQPIDSAFERTLECERPHMQLVENRGGQGRSLPTLIAPGEVGMIQRAGRTVDAVGLPRRSRIW